MAKFSRKGKGGMPAISTASLPDIIFMLLFFFMVTTVMREVELKVEYKAAQATEIKKLEKKSLVSYIYVGKPKNTTLGDEPRIQLNDQFAKLSDIPNYIIAERESRNEAEVPFLTTSLKVDKDTKMGIVTDLKLELRKMNALKINYSARRRDKEL